MRAIQRETNLRWLEVDGKWGLFEIKLKDWTGLTDEEALACRGLHFFDTYKNIEAKLKEKNCG